MNASNKRRIDEKSAAFIRGRRLLTFLLVPAAFIRGRRLFKGGVYSSNYGSGLASFGRFWPLFVSVWLSACAQPTNPDSTIQHSAPKLPLQGPPYFNFYSHLLLRSMVLF